MSPDDRTLTLDEHIVPDTNGRNPWECDYCGQPSPSHSPFLCLTCCIIEKESNGDMAIESMYSASVRLLLAKGTLMQHPMA